jgi:nitrite reductase/ring-hydroxylating ferredoxin subunit
MLVVRFATTGKGNCVQVGGMAYVYARTVAGSFVLPAACAHRGGPLHLARLNETRTKLVCPWHGGTVSVSRLVRSGVPAVRNGSRVVAVFPHDAGTKYWLEHRPMSPDVSTAPDPSRSPR